MRLALMLAVTFAAALDIGSFYLLPMKGAGELNGLVVALGPLAVVGKLMLAAALVWAVLHRHRYSPLVGSIAVGVWSFGAIINSL